MTFEVFIHPSLHFLPPLIWHSGFQWCWNLSHLSYGESRIHLGQVASLSQGQHGQRQTFTHMDNLELQKYKLFLYQINKYNRFQIVRRAYLNTEFSTLVFFIFFNVKNVKKRCDVADVCCLY